MGVDKLAGVLDATLEVSGEEVLVSLPEVEPVNWEFVGVDLNPLDAVEARLVDEAIQV